MEILKKLSAKVFKYGGYVPKSVAIIMDGNRRYAVKNKFEKIKGHEDGLKKLLEVVEWSLYFEVKEVTAFAFSIDNFNRPKEEFDNLVKLAKDKFTYLTEKGEYFDAKQIRVCFYGNLDILQDNELVSKFKKMEEETKNNNILKLNICFSYNSSEEIIRAFSKLNQKVKEDQEKLNENNLNEIHLNKSNESFKNNSNLNKNNRGRKIKNPNLQIENFKSEDNDKENISFYSNNEILLSKESLKKEFEKNLYGGYNCKPDILIRTSGEIRLSNFLLYQTRFSMLFFIDKFWPELTFFDFLKILVRYNYSYKSHMQKIKEIEKEFNVII